MKLWEARRIRTVPAWGLVSLVITSSFISLYSSCMWRREVKKKKKRRWTHAQSPVSWLLCIHGSSLTDSALGTVHRTCGLPQTWTRREEEEYPNFDLRLVSFTFPPKESRSRGQPRRLFPRLSSVRLDCKRAESHRAPAPAAPTLAHSPWM